MKLFVALSILTILSSCAVTGNAGPRRIEGWRLKRCFEVTNDIQKPQCITESALRCTTMKLEASCGVDEVSP